MTLPYRTVMCYSAFNIALQISRHAWLIGKKPLLEPIRCYKKAIDVTKLREHNLS
jgi:hypothetical protein